MLREWPVPVHGQGRDAAVNAAPSSTHRARSSASMLGACDSPPVVCECARTKKAGITNLGREPVARISISIATAHWIGSSGAMPRTSGASMAGTRGRSGAASASRPSRIARRATDLAEHGESTAPAATTNGQHGSNQTSRWMAVTLLWPSFYWSDRADRASIGDGGPSRARRCRYCASMFATFINLSVSAISARRLCASSSGVLGTTAAPVGFELLAHLGCREGLLQRKAHLLRRIHVGWHAPARRRFRAAYAARDRPAWG